MLEVIIKQKQTKNNKSKNKTKKKGEKMKIDNNTTIFIEKENDSNIYNVEIANHLSRKKIADIKLERITNIRFQVKTVQIY